MAEARIPVDLFNPGQVFACLGFMEAADILCGEAECWFDWSDEDDVKFCLQASCEHNPFGVVLEFLSSVEVKAIAPIGWRPKEEPTDKEKTKQKKLEIELSEQIHSDKFPSKWPDKSTAMPVQVIGQHERSIVLSHWADGSSRYDFKLYAGTRSGLAIAKAMLLGIRGKPKKSNPLGDLKTKGLAQLWQDRKDDMKANPFECLTPIGGSFYFDPRKTWTRIDTGYAPDTHKHKVMGSPVVEILATCGLENARPSRPDASDYGRILYTTWGVALSPMLSRATIFGDFEIHPCKRFNFRLNSMGENKFVTFSKLEEYP